MPFFLTHQILPYASRYEKYASRVDRLHTKIKLLKSTLLKASENRIPSRVI